MGQCIMMHKTVRLVFSAVLLVSAALVHGQTDLTGVGLIIQQPVEKNKYNKTGGLYIIHVKDGKYVKAVGPVAKGAISPRFSADGKEFVYLSGGKCVVADINGKTLRSWNAGGGQVTWGKTAIWVHTSGAAYTRYDPVTGKKLGSVNTKASMNKGRMSYQENATAGWTSSGNKIGVKSGSGWKAVYIGLSKTCSMCPSPSGNLFTANLWDGGAKHRKMDIRNKSGKRIYTFELYSSLPQIPKKTPFAWNAQLWTGHHEDWILLPAGRGQTQWEKSAIPFVFNIKTKKSIMMAPDVMMNKMWAPYDFYFRALPGSEALRPATISVTPDTVTVNRGATTTFTAIVNDQNGKPLATQPTLTWSVDGGGTMAGNVFTAGQQTGGPYTVTATTGDVTGTAKVVVEKPTATESLLELVSPNGGETFTVGQAMTIKYNANKDSLAGVVIYYSHDNGRTRMFIDSTYVSPMEAWWGNHTWIIPATLPREKEGGVIEDVSVVSTQGRIILEEYNNSDRQSKSANSFTIKAADVATIDLVAPSVTRPASLLMARNGTIRIDAGSVKSLRYEILAPNGAVVRSRSLTGGGIHPLPLSGIGAGSYVVRIIAGSHCTEHPVTIR